MIDSPENFKQIDDIIDARKKMGQYDVCKQQPAPINYRYAYSSTISNTEKFIRSEDAVMLVNEGDYFNNSELKSTDSEITIMRVRCDGLTFKRRPSKWDMHDIAIPGDGSHLGESPSLVNLATLVEQNEYLVPLSSWDPYSKADDSDSIRASRANDYLYDINHINNNNKTTEDDSENAESQFSEDISLENKSSGRRPSLAGKISKFFRKHCKRAKTLPEQYQPGGHNSTSDDRKD